MIQYLTDISIVPISYITEEWKNKYVLHLHGSDNHNLISASMTKVEKPSENKN